MPDLRSMIDGKVLCAAPPRASKPSPTAQKVAETLQDPVGATRDKFQKLNEAKLNYDKLRHETLMDQIPTLSVIKHIAQTHGVMPNVGTPQLDQGQMNPNMTGNPDDPEQYDEDGNPVNMTQQPGKLQSPRPSQVGTMPGVAPGPAQSAVPPKMGMPQPGGGGGNPAKSGMGKPSPVASKGKSNPAAKKPTPGGKPAPGKNGNGKEIELHIKGSGDIGKRVLAGASNRLETQLGMGTLMAGGPGSGRRKGYGSGVISTPRNELDREQMRRAAEREERYQRMVDRHRNYGTPRNVADVMEDAKKKSVSADIGTTLHEKTDVPGDEAALNPVMRANRKRRRAAKRGWSTKSHGHLSAKEKKAHWGTVKGLKK